jgi:ATP-dependent DNA helicase RecG
VFSLADQAWLSGYRPLRLSREEMLVAMFGKNSQLMSPQQIYERLDLHDWDVYRTIFEQLSYKGLIYNTMSEAQKNNAAKKAGISKREIPRLAIRHPEVLERSLTEVLTALRQIPNIEYIDKEYRTKILNRLPLDNAYKSSDFGLGRLLRTLGLIDAENAPTRDLKDLWRQQLPDQAQLSGVLPSSQSPPMITKAPRDKGSNRPEAIYVGNLNYETTERDLRALFAPFGEVIGIRIPVDYTTGRGRGFAFVRMADRHCAARAREGLQGASLLGAAIRLDWVR